MVRAKIKQLVRESGKKQEGQDWRYDGSFFMKETGREVAVAIGSGHSIIHLMSNLPNSDTFRTCEVVSIRTVRKSVVWTVTRRPKPLHLLYINDHSHTMIVYVDSPVPDDLHVACKEESSFLLLP